VASLQTVGRKRHADPAADVDGTGKKEGQE
jgi:hypothetical protein